jgi:hypothetical protein
VADQFSESGSSIDVRHGNLGRLQRAGPESPEQLGDRPLSAASCHDEPVDGGRQQMICIGSRRENFDLDLTEPACVPWALVHHHTVVHKLGQLFAVGVAEF